MITSVIGIASVSRLKDLSNVLYGRKDAATLSQWWTKCLDLKK